MALVQNSYRRFAPLISCLSVRFQSSGKTVSEKDIKKSVFISQSKDVYTNLAMEEWIHRHYDFNNHHILLISQNDPCVLIGHNQNPWIEANHHELTHITEKGVPVARRASGGGVMYHDNGILNLTFFTTKERLNQNYNMSLITRGIFRDFGLTVRSSEHEELYIRNHKKVCETGLKLGSKNSYQNCSLLISANKMDLNLALQDHTVNIKTRAEKSTKSTLMNLREEIPKISVPKATKAIGWEFLRTRALTLIDGGMELASQQNGFQLINPTELWFPGLNELRNKYQSWNWCYGKTPKFRITRTFTVPERLLEGNTGSSDLQITMVVKEGRIHNIKLFVPPGFSPCGFTGEATVMTTLKGQKFSQESINSLELSLNNLVDEKERFVTECLKQVVTCV